MTIKTFAEATAVPVTKGAGTPSKPLAVSVDEFCRLTSIRRSTAFKLIREGRVDACRIGRRTLILMVSIEALLLGVR